MIWLLLALLPLGFLLGWMSGYRRALRTLTRIYLDTLQILARMLKDKDYKQAKSLLADILAEYPPSAPQGPPTSPKEG